MCNAITIKTWSDQVLVLMLELGNKRQISAFEVFNHPLIDFNAQLWTEVILPVTSFPCSIKLIKLQIQLTQ